MSPSSFSRGNAYVDAEKKYALDLAHPEDLAFNETLFLLMLAIEDHALVGVDSIEDVLSPRKPVTKDIVLKMNEEARMLPVFRREICRNGVWQICPKNALPYHRVEYIWSRLLLLAGFEGTLLAMSFFYVSPVYLATERATLKDLRYSGANDLDRDQEIGERERRQLLAHDAAGDFDVRKSLALPMMSLNAHRLVQKSYRNSASHVDLSALAEGRKQRPDLGYCSGCVLSSSAALHVLILSLRVLAYAIESLSVSRETSAPTDVPTLLLQQLLDEHPQLQPCGKITLPYVLNVLGTDFQAAKGASQRTVELVRGRREGADDVQMTALRRAVNDASTRPASNVNRLKTAVVRCPQTPLKT